MIREDSDRYAPVATERCSSHQIECRCSRVSVRRVNRAYNRPTFALPTAKRLQPLTGEALESDEAAASEYIFLRTASMLVSPSEWLWLFPSPWLLLLLSL